MRSDKKAKFAFSQSTKSKILILQSKVCNFTKRIFIDSASVHTYTHIYMYISTHIYLHTNTHIFAHQQTHILIQKDTKNIHNLENLER